MSAYLTLPAVTQMTHRLTAPFGRGADTLPLTLRATGSAIQSPVAAYDFGEHQALYNQPPAPRYLLTLLQDLAVDTQVQVDYVARPGGRSGWYHHLRSLTAGRLLE